MESQLQDLTLKDNEDTSTVPDNWFDVEDTHTTSKNLDNEDTSTVHDNWFDREDTHTIRKNSDVESNDCPAKNNTKVGKAKSNKCSTENITIAGKTKIPSVNASYKLNVNFNVSVNGLQMVNGENLQDTILDIANFLKIPAEGILLAQRTVSRTDKNSHLYKTRPVIVTFNTQEQRNKFLFDCKQSKKAIYNKNIINGGDNTRIYIGEYMTRETYLLFVECKKVAKNINYKFVFVENGDIFMKKTHDSPQIHIKKESQLWALFENSC